MENACGGCGKADHADGAKFCAACGRNLRETGIYLLGSRMSVRQHSGGLDLVRHLVDGGSIERAVIDGHLEVLEHLDVDGDDFWRVQLEEEIVTNFSGLSSRLRASGRVLDRRNVDDVLSAVLRGCRTSGKSHATFGVYAEDGELRLCTDPVPVKEEQRKAWEVVKPLLRHEVTAEEVRGYVEIQRFWHPYEILPAQGLGFMGPFALLLRSHRVLVPHLFPWAPEADLGKSLTNLIGSEFPWGLEHTSGPGLNSHYRLASHLDAINLPRAVEEAEGLKPELWPVLKESAERRLADKRGTPDLGMLDYLSRAVFLMSGNALPMSTEAVLKRFLVIRFDSSVRLQRRGQSRAVEAAVTALKPIGYTLLRWALEMWPTEEALLSALDETEEAIAAGMPRWVSPKRPQAWACVYLGLQMLQEGCRRLDVTWSIPDIAAFVRDVVEPVESSTWDLRRSQVDRFAAWFAMWRTRNEWTIREGDESRVVIRGQDEIFQESDVKVRGQTVPGWWVTNPLLQDYNRWADGEAKIPSLAELGKQAADAAALPYEAVMDLKEAKSPQARKIRIGGKPVRAVFLSSIEVYRNLWNFGTNGEPGGVPKGGSGRGVFGTGVPGGSEKGSRSNVPKELPTPLYTDSLNATEHLLIEEEVHEALRADPRIVPKFLMERVLDELQKATISGSPVPRITYEDLHRIALEMHKSRAPDKKEAS